MGCWCCVASPPAGRLADGKFKAELTFPSVTWRRASPGDQLSLRVYSGLIYTNPDALDIRRGVLPPDNGTATSPSCTGSNVTAADPLGGFAACCDSDAQCNTPLICDTTRRVCTRTCTSESQCSDLVEPRTGVPRCISGYCAADRALGWSFAPFCQV